MKQRRGKRAASLAQYNARVKAARKIAGSPKYDPYGTMREMAIGASDNVSKGKRTAYNRAIINANSSIKSRLKSTTKKRKSAVLKATDLAERASKAKKRAARLAFKKPRKSSRPAKNKIIAKAKVAAKTASNPTKKAAANSVKKSAVRSFLGKKPK